MRAALNAITDTDAEIDILAVLQKRQADNRFAATAGMAIAILRALKDNVSVEDWSDFGCPREDMSLSQLSKAIREHPGRFGICFEHGIHYGIAHRMQPMYGYVSATLRAMFGWDWPIESILYGIEKRSPDAVLSKFDELFGEDPVLITRCNPGTALTKDLLTRLRKPKEWSSLPDDLSGLFKTDLFLGSREHRLWTSVSVKSIGSSVEERPGLALAIYPAEKKYEGKIGDVVAWSMGRVTLHLPIPTEDSFMKDFHTAFRTVSYLVSNRFPKPERREFYDSLTWWLANFLYERRKQRIVDVEAALAEHADAQESVYLPRQTSLITDPEEVWKQLPNDLKKNLLISALPIYAESPTLNFILKP